MSADHAVHAAFVEALRARGELYGIEGVSAETSGGALPQVVVEPPSAIGWGTKTERGREVRTSVRVRVAKGQASRLPALIGAVEAAGESLTGALGRWRVASAILTRTRTGTGAKGTIVAVVEHRVRVLENMV